MKFETAQIYFLGDFLGAVVVVVAKLRIVKRCAMFY